MVQHDHKKVFAWPTNCFKLAAILSAFIVIHFSFPEMGVAETTPGLDSIVITQKKFKSKHTKSEQAMTTMLSSSDVRDNNTKSYRFLFGIFTFDSDNEYMLRRGHRMTYLKWFKFHHHLSPEKILEKNYPSVDGICSLNHLLTNKTLAQDPDSCFIIYTYVVGGGNPKTRPTICYWGDQDCGDSTNAANYTLPNGPEYNFSHPEELREHNDFTFLSVRENQNEGKTESWFTYASALTKKRLDLDIDFVGKLDSDTILRSGRLKTNTIQMDGFKDAYIYGGHQPVSRKTCSRGSWGKVCQSPLFKAPVFVPGGFVFLSTGLARHVFLNGISLESKRSHVFPNHEDMSLANIAYADPNTTVTLLSFENTAFHPVKKKFQTAFWKKSSFLNRTALQEAGLAK